MEQLEVISWKMLDALRNSATKTFKTIGDIDTDEQMSVFCQIEEDFIELYYSETESSYIRRFDDEDEFFSSIEGRKEQMGEEDFDTLDFYDDDGGYQDDNSDDFNGYDIKDSDDNDEF